MRDYQILRLLALALVFIPLTSVEFLGRVGDNHGRYLIVAVIFYCTSLVLKKLQGR